MAGLPSSLTDVANLALELIGEAPINNIDTSDDITSQTIRRWIDVVIREVQMDIHWNENYSDLVELTPVTDDFAGVAGQYQYLLPTDFLQVYEISARPNLSSPTTSVDVRGWATPWWKLEQGYLIARSANIVMLYGRYNDDVSSWSSQQLEVIYTALATKICYLITNNQAKSQEMEVKLKLVKDQAYSSRQNKGRSYKTRPGFFGMARARQAAYGGPYPARGYRA